MPSQEEDNQSRPQDEMDMDETNQNLDLKAQGETFEAISISTEATDDHTKKSDIPEVLSSELGEVDPMSRPKSQDAFDDEIVKPFIESQMSSDESDHSISKDVTKFKEDCQDQNNFETEGQEMDIVNQEDESAQKSELGESNYNSEKDSEVLEIIQSTSEEEDIMNSSKGHEGDESLSTDTFIQSQTKEGETDLAASTKLSVSTEESLTEDNKIAVINDEGQAEKPSSEFSDDFEFIEYQSQDGENIEKITQITEVEDKNVSHTRSEAVNDDDMDSLNLLVKEEESSNSDSTLDSKKEDSFSEDHDMVKTGQESDSRHLEEGNIDITDTLDMHVLQSSNISILSDEEAQETNDQILQSANESIDDVSKSSSKVDESTEEVKVDTENHSLQ